MTIFQGIILGILQGIAEFLPISSSGHLALVQNIFKLNSVPLLFDVMLHLATLAAVILYFRKKIWKLLCVFANTLLRKKCNSEDFSCAQEDGLCGSEEISKKTIVAIIIATFITGAIGIFTSKMIPELPVKYVCIGFIVTAILLITSTLYENRKNKPEQNSEGISWKQSVVIGLMQGIGTLPGISRSGSTISGSLFSGVKRSVAGEFSFIVSIPAIFAAFLLELKDLGEVSASIGAAPVIAGCAAAFASGYISLVYLMKLIRKGKLCWFAAYLIPLGILGIIFLH